MAVQVRVLPNPCLPVAKGLNMSDYKQLSKLYNDLGDLAYIKRNVTEARENPQTQDHIFKLDVSPRVNSRSFLGCKIKYRKELLVIIEGEITDIKERIKQISDN